MNAELIDTVVRFHDTRRLPELTRAIFSLASQTYRPLRIVLAVQRFSEADIALTKAALHPLIADEPDLELTVVNWPEPEPRDARSVLLNIGVREAIGRYLAFLDYDDVIYPEAYELLAARLHSTRAAIAFASVRTMRLEVFDQFFYTDGAVPPFGGKNLIDLFGSNFCPLHSYLIDRSQVQPDLLAFQPTLTIEEDYDVLLRICARYRSDFKLIGTQIGDYYYKSDGSNTIPHGVPPSEDMLERYKAVRETIERRRRTTIVSADVRNQLMEQFGLAASPRPWSIREILDRFS